MLNLKYTGYFFTTLWLLINLSACHNSTVVKKASKSQVSSAVIKKLIALGEHFENAKKDSMPGIAKQLYSINGATGDPTALFYAEILESKYYWESVDYKKAMQLALKSLADAEKWKINKALPEIYAVMGNVHKENHNYKLAFEDADQGVAAARATKDTANLISLLGLKAMFVRGLSQNKNESPLTDSSTRLQFRALRIAESNPAYEILRIRFYDNISQHYIDVAKYDTSIYYANKGIALALKHNQQRSLTFGYTWLGTALYNKGQTEMGMYYMKKALHTAQSIKQPFRMMEIDDYISRSYAASSNYRESNTYLKKARALHDSLQILSNEKQLSELQIKYETAKKDKEILVLSEETQTRKTQLLWILVGVAIFVVFLVILLFQYRVIRNNGRIIKDSLNAKNKALNDIAYIQSHHLRKPVASILGLMNVIKAEDYHAEKDVLEKMEQATLQLDERIKAINEHTQIPL
jgi:hypothetical protein